MNIIEIKNDKMLCKINPGLGARCTGLVWRGGDVHILREPPAADDVSVLYGIPVLFPVNRISGACFNFDGRTYSFPVNEPETGCFLHGELNSYPFETVYSGENRAAFLYRADKSHPYLTFPHEFELIIEYILENNSLLHNVTIINNSEKRMPVMLGFHTTFAVDKNSRIGAETGEYIARNKDYLPTGIETDDETSKLLNEGNFNPCGKQISKHYHISGSGLITVTHPEKHLRIVYENDSKYRYRLFYNGDADGYICLEPQTCMVDCMHNDFGIESGLRVIEPGRSETYRSVIRAEEI